jgi:hypothetical protein
MGHLDRAARGDNAAGLTDQASAGNADIVPAAGAGDRDHAARNVELFEAAVIRSVEHRRRGIGATGVEAQAIGARPARDGARNAIKAGQGERVVAIAHIDIALDRAGNNQRVRPRAPRNISDQLLARQHIDGTVVQEHAAGVGGVLVDAQLARA